VSCSVQLLLYCIYFCFSVPNKTISISISISNVRIAAGGTDKTPATSGGASNFQLGELNLGHMTSARSASLYGGLGAQPPAGSRGRAPGGGSAGRSPSEAVSSLAFGRPSDEANLHHFRNFAVTEPHIFFIYIPTVSRETIFSTP